MPTSNHIAGQRTEGFIHNGRIVYALSDKLEASPPSYRHVIVWLDRDGNALGQARREDASRRIVTTKPGEYIRFKSKREKVLALKSIGQGYNTEGLTTAETGNNFAVASSAWWDVIGNYGPLRPMDFEFHDELAVRLGASRVPSEVAAEPPNAAI